MILLFIIAIILIKTSFLGLGLVSIATGTLGIIFTCVIRFSSCTENLAKFKRLFKTALCLHISIYLLLALKLFLIDGVEDIPAFIVSHLILHHFMSAFIGAVLTFQLIRIYNFKNQISTAE